MNKPPIIIAYSVVATLVVVAIGYTLFSIMSDDSNLAQNNQQSSQEVSSFIDNQNSVEEEPETTTKVGTLESEDNQEVTGELLDEQLKSLESELDSLKLFANYSTQIFNVVDNSKVSLSNEENTLLGEAIKSAAKQYETVCDDITEGHSGDSDYKDMQDSCNEFILYSTALGTRITTDEPDRQSANVGAYMERLGDMDKIYDRIKGAVVRG